MALLREFIDDYRGKISHFEHLAHTCAYQCERALKRQGVRALVTSRAKRLDSLASKVDNRAQEKNYQSIEEIYEDIVDLAGVRIALFFPQDREEVDQFIRSHFNVDNVKDFPEALGHPGAYQKQFLGYVGRHYRLYLKPETLSPQEKHLADHVIEVQVGSVLMHAWAEVEHDLVYKSTGGFLSHDEYAILDELNGLMHEGEIALERLQTAVKRRVNSEQQPFSNHYELSSYLYDQKRRFSTTTPCQLTLGRTDVLFHFLRLTELNSVSALRSVLQACDFNSREPLDQQIVNRVLLGNPQYYAVYDQARLAVGLTDPFGTAYEAESYFSPETSAGPFLEQWIACEQELGELLFEGAPDRFDEPTWEQLKKARKLRTQVLFGEEAPLREELDQAEEFLRRFLADLERSNAG